MAKSAGDKPSGPKRAPAKRSGAQGRETAGGRPLTVKLKSARRRKPSSAEWLTRQLNDPYVAAARRHGYRSRAAFKLIELDDRFRVLKRGGRILDLGCAPGGWTQVAVERAGAHAYIVGVDLAETAAIAGAVLLRADLTEPKALSQIQHALGGPADTVLSDMAPATTGHAATDHLRIVVLAEAALAIAERVLTPGGVFVAKVFQGGAGGDLLSRLRHSFSEVRHAKPAASRAESTETYVVARGFRKLG